MIKGLQISMLCLFLGLTACNQKRPAQRISSRDAVRTPGGGTVGAINPTTKPCGDGCAWGKFYGEYGSSFEENVRRYASVSVPMQEIGQINPDLNGTDTGVWFWGEIALQGGTLRSLLTGTQTSMSVGSNSRLGIVVYDSYSTQAENKQSPIASLFTGTSPGRVTGTIARGAGTFDARIQFSDQWGLIILDGKVTSNTGDLNTALFQGKVHFQNNCAMNPETGACEENLNQAVSLTEMGSFVVEACRFFSCQ
jgi:hypothetical protein